MCNHALYQKAIDTWGLESQQIVAIEELSELAKEICKVKRGVGNLNHLAEEIADVEIMCDQLRYMFAADGLVDEWKKRKLMRLRERLGE